MAARPFNAKSRQRHVPITNAAKRKAVKLPRAFYGRDTVKVARELLGKQLVRRHSDGITVGRIVETEAYVGPHDKACHAARGRTARTEVMFHEPGHAYVYFIYGFHYMLNLVTERNGFPAAVLIRAVEPLRGLPLMKQRRRIEDVRQLASGPGKLCQAFAIDRSLNGADLCGSVLFLRDAHEPAPAITITPRIGVDYAGEWKDKPFRFLITGNSFVSRR